MGETMQPRSEWVKIAKVLSLFVVVTTDESRSNGKEAALGAYLT
jgi:hypothetical protein